MSSTCIIIKQKGRVRERESMRKFFFLFWASVYMLTFSFFNFFSPLFYQSSLAPKGVAASRFWASHCRIIARWSTLTTICAACLTPPPPPPPPFLPSSLRSGVSSSLMSRDCESSLSRDSVEVEEESLLSAALVEKRAWFGTVSWSNSY